MPGRSEFAERIFEFGFNSEVVRRRRSELLLGTPMIPSQREEASLGFDARFALKGSRFLFFQYKIGYHAEKRRGRGAATYDLHHGPYVHVKLPSKGAYRQHNTLVELQKSLPEDDVFYVVPSFAEASTLQAHITADELVANCRFISLAGARSLTDADGPHGISFAVNKMETYLRSEPTQLTALGWPELLTQERERSRAGRRVDFGRLRREFVAAARKMTEVDGDGYQTLGSADEQLLLPARLKAELPDQTQTVDRQEIEAIETIASICTYNLGLSWFALP